MFQHVNQLQLVRKETDDTSEEADGTEASSDDPLLPPFLGLHNDRCGDGEHQGHHAGKAGEEHSRERDDRPQLYVVSEAPRDDVVHEAEHKQFRDFGGDDSDPVVLQPSHPHVDEAGEPHPHHQVARHVHQRYPANEQQL